jgi:hypothetical protein
VKTTCPFRAHTPQSGATPRTAPSRFKVLRNFQGIELGEPAVSYFTQVQRAFALLSELMRSCY